MNSYASSQHKKTASQQSPARSDAGHEQQPIQRAEGKDNSSPESGALAHLQTSFGNQAVIQMFKKSDLLQGETSEATGPPNDQTRMPLDVQAKMESSLGADFSDVRIHKDSSKASAAGALAYTQGTDIHFAPGQYNPEHRDGQKLIGHELAHVIQQKAGRVSPTGQLSSGTLLNDNPALEQEADTLGAKAANSPEPGPQAIQRAVDVSGAKPTTRIGDPLVIQRMPSTAQVKSTLGEPKAHTKNPLYSLGLSKSKIMKENSTHYRSFLDKLQAFDSYVDTEVVGDKPDVIDAQLGQVMTLYDGVETVSADYITHNKDDKKDKKVVYIRKLKENIPFEKKAVRSAAAEYKIDSGKERPYWKLLTSTSLLNLTTDMETGATGSGGINKVNFFEIGPNVEGVFKSDKNELHSYDEMPSTATEKEKDSADTEYFVGTKDAQIDPKDARMANRNIAMTRLNDLLGGNVIARAQFALYNTGTSIVQGSYMEKAKGKSAGDVLNNTLDEIEAGQQASFDVNDPGFQQSMSRLQLIDTLAMQVDRHYGNFYIHTDNSGNFLGVTGIDNDMAFGTVTDLDTKRKEYPGLSRLVDKEMAEKIVALKAEDLAAIMDGLLSPNEILALITRLTKLQEHLKKESTRLLTTEEWATVTQAERQGDKSYGANIDKPIENSKKKAAAKAQSGK